LQGFRNCDKLVDMSSSQVREKDAYVASCGYYMIG
jgi:hypothetical protein